MIGIERYATAKAGRLKEAFEMFDSFSDGNLHYGLAATIVGAVMVLAVVLHLI